jgi:hypothetical protein
MIGDLLIAIVTMAVIFVLAGLLRIKLGCGGHCDSCSNDCEIDTEGRHP